MYCPSMIFANNKFLYINHHQEGDRNYLEQVPWKELLNPLRYEIIFRWRWNNKARINQGAKWHLFASDCIYYARKTFSYRIKGEDVYIQGREGRGVINQPPKGEI